MDCSVSRGDDMKVSESKVKKRVSRSHEKGAKEKKPRTKKRRLLKRGTRVSKEKPETKKKKKKSTKDRTKLFEEMLKETELIYGGRMVAYDRDDPSTCYLGEDLKSLVDLAIDFYNTKNNGTEYRMVSLIRVTYISVQGALFDMTMTVKLPDQDDDDAVTLQAVVWEGIEDNVVRSVHELDAPPLSHVST